MITIQIPTSELTETDKQVITQLSEQGLYRNSREIMLGGLPYAVREAIMVAPRIAALNTYLVGGTGEGKSQLVNQLEGAHRDSFCYAEGRPDFELAELMRQLNLEKLGKVKSDRELIELTENVRKALYYVDELPRCPPIVQNYFFNFFDGKLVHGGKILRLGKDGYSVGYASGNIGKEYVGSEDTDRALKDRMHLIVKLDHPDFVTMEGDDWDIFSGTKNPRAKLSEEGKDITSQVISLHRTFSQREVPLILCALGMYFHKGLDYLENTPKHSKRAVDQAWPNVQGIRTDADENKVMPLSKRAILATIGFTEALRMIAEAKGTQVPDIVELYLDALRFTIPHSGVLSPQFVQMEKGEDAYAAFDALMDSWRADIRDKKGDLETAIAYALYGEQEETCLDRICPPGTLGKWTPVRRGLEHLASKKPVFEAQTLADIREEYKKPEQ